MTITTATERAPSCSVWRKKYQKAQSSEEKATLTVVLKFSSVSSFFYIKYPFVRLVLGAETLHHIRARWEGQTSTKFTFKFPFGEKWPSWSVEKAIVTTIRVEVTIVCSSNGVPTSTIIANLRHISRKRMTRSWHASQTTTAMRSSIFGLSSRVRRRIGELCRVRIKIFLVLIVVDGTQDYSHCRPCWPETNVELREARETAVLWASAFRRVMIIWNSLAVSRGRKL